jgi:hypothetical protein
MKIRSINDIITNSSDETFVIKTSKSPKEILQELETELDRHPGLRRSYSGMGGILQAASREDFGNLEYLDSYDYLVWLPDNHVIVVIDYGWIEQLVKYLKDNYVVINEIDFQDTMVIPFLRAKADDALKALEMMTKQEDIDKAYSEWKPWKELLEEYE